MLVHGGGGHPRPKTGNGASAVKTCDEPNLGLLQARDDIPNVVRSDVHIAVAEDQDIVSCERKHAEYVRYLRLSADWLRPDRQFDVAIRKLLAQFLSQGDRWI